MKGSEPGARLRKPHWDLSRLPKFEKNFYNEMPTVTARGDVSWQFVFSAKKNCFMFNFLELDRNKTFHVWHPLNRISLH